MRRFVTVNPPRKMRLVDGYPPRIRSSSIIVLKFAVVRLTGPSAASPMPTLRG